MPFCAMCFSCILGREADAMKDVFFACYRFKVSRIYTSWITAKMVQMQPHGNRANE